MSDKYKELGLWLLGGLGIALLVLFFICGLIAVVTFSDILTDDGMEKTHIEELHIESEGVSIHIKNLDVEVSNRLLIPFLLNMAQ